MVERVAAERRRLSHSVCKVHGPQRPASSRGKKGIIKKCKVTHIFFISPRVVGRRLRGTADPGNRGGAKRTIGNGKGAESLVIGE